MARPHRRTRLSVVTNVTRDAAGVELEVAVTARLVDLALEPLPLEPLRTTAVGEWSLDLEANDVGERWLVTERVAGAPVARHLLEVPESEEPLALVDCLAS